MERARRQNLVWWGFIAALVVLSGVLGYLQYRWIGAVSHAEREDLRERLASGLNRVSRQLNTGLTSVAETLVPSGFNPQRAEREQAYAEHFQQVKNSANGHLVKSLSLASPGTQDIELRRLDSATGEF